MLAEESSKETRKESLELFMHSIDNATDDFSHQAIQRGDYAEAQRLFEQQIALTVKAYGPDHPKVAEVLFKLAKVHEAQGHHEDAEKLTKRALAIQNSSGR